MKTSTTLALSVLFIIAFLSLGAQLNPEEEFSLILDWQKPKVYPPPMLAGMKIATLNIMLESGNLQWYEPRPEKDAWDGVVGQKVHAPIAVIWEIAMDYELQCKIMPQTFVTCQTQSRNGNQVTNVYRIKTSVIMYSYNFDMVDSVVEDPPTSQHIETLEGGLKGREIDLLLIPVDDGANTLVFMRYYGSMRSLGASMRMALTVLPMVEPPTTVGAANYHLRAYKNEAEKRVGYQAPAKPRDLEIDSLDIPTLRLINKGNGGLIRETPEGKLIDVLTYTFIDAPPERVWEVATDFEHYAEIFPGSSAEVESRDGNTVLMRSSMAKFSVLIFDFGYELHSRYNLNPPTEFTYFTVDGLYEGTHGGLRLMPIENGTKTLLFATAGLNLDRDTGLVARIIKSGAFPVENMLNMIGAQSTIAHIKREAERRDAKQEGAGFKMAP